jgi:hypothetical protein
MAFVVVDAFIIPVVEVAHCIITIFIIVDPLPRFTQNKIVRSQKA